MSNALTREEQIVLNVVQEYLDKNRQFNMEKILPFIISRFRLASINISKNGIEEILRNLIKKDFLVEGSKLSRDDILLNLKRLQIYNFILRNPGSYFNRIINELNLSNHIVVWHLNMLLKFNYIRKEVFDNHEIYFDTTLDFEQVKVSYFTSKEKSRKIIDYLKSNNDGITKTRLSEVLKMHPNTISKYLNSLLEHNIINKEQISNKTLYFLK